MDRSRKVSPKINFDLTPLIDIILQLVIFFMITTTFKTSPGIILQLLLPRRHNPLPLLN